MVKGTLLVWLRLKTRAVTTLLYPGRLRLMTGGLRGSREPGPRQRGSLTHLLGFKEREIGMNTHCACACMWCKCVLYIVFLQHCMLICEHVFVLCMLECVYAYIQCIFMSLCVIHGHVCMCVCMQVCILIYATHICMLPIQACACFCAYVYM